MDISVVNSRAIYKGLYPKGMELLELKLVLAKSLIGLYNSRSRNTLVRHVSRREVLPASVQLHLQVLQKTGRKCRHCYTGGIKNKTYIQGNTCGAFRAWFPAKDLETFLQISIAKFKGNKHLFYYYSFISSLPFTLGYLASILFIWVRNALIKI